MAEDYLGAHPDTVIAPGSSGQHAAHVKTAVLAHLAEVLTQLSSSEQGPAEEEPGNQPLAAFDAGSLAALAAAPPYELAIKPGGVPVGDGCYRGR